MGRIFFPLIPSGVARTERSIVSCVGEDQGLSDSWRTARPALLANCRPTRVKGKKMRGAAGGGSQI